MNRFNQIAVIAAAIGTLCTQSAAMAGRNWEAYSPSKNPVSSTPSTTPASVPQYTVYSKPLPAPPIQQSNQYSTGLNSVIAQAQKYPNKFTVYVAQTQILQAMAATQARAQYDAAKYSSPTITSPNSFLAPYQAVTNYSYNRR